MVNLDWMPELTASVAIIGIGCMAGLSWTRVADKIRAHRERQRQQSLDVIASLQALSHALAQVPVLVEGLAELCKVESGKVDTLDRAIEALSRAVDLLQSTMAPDPNQNPYEEYAESVSEPAARRREVTDLIQAGVSAEEAKRRAKEKDIYLRASYQR